MKSDTAPTTSDPCCRCLVLGTTSAGVTGVHYWLSGGINTTNASHSWKTDQGLTVTLLDPSSDPTTADISILVLCYDICQKDSLLGLVRDWQGGLTCEIKVLVGVRHDQHVSADLFEKRHGRGRAAQHMTTRLELQQAAYDLRAHAELAVSVQTGQNIPKLKNEVVRLAHLLQEGVPASLAENQAFVEELEDMRTHEAAIASQGQSQRRDATDTKFESTQSSVPNVEVPKAELCGCIVM